MEETQQNVTSLKPFKLRIEQRVITKEEEFMKKIHNMMTEEESQRIPIAQGLPWTTDEPEVRKPTLLDILLKLEKSMKHAILEIEKLIYGSPEFHNTWTMTPWGVKLRK
ncbi:hypothetical protein LINGRAHAP2_LOCUS23706 [Linum grandiflorum]